MLPQSVRAVVVAVLTVTTDAYWRLPCGIIQIGRLDPVIDHGIVSPHVHRVSGPSNINPNSTYDTIRTAGCTSCPIQADKSGYWTPQLYYIHPNGSAQTVDNSGMTVYYLGRGDNRDKAVPFPPGFRMAGGDPYARSYDAITKTYLDGRVLADRISFTCLDYDHPTPEVHGLTESKLANCPGGFRAQVHMPSCWNGVDLYQDDGLQGHVAYMSGIDNGVCPPTHPVQFVHLFYEVLYSLDSITQSPGGFFTFANGDPTGYAFHGVFLNGWDIPTLTSAIKECAYNEPSNGNISDCPVLQASVDDKYLQTCPPRAQLIDEPTVGLIPHLPGCNELTYGPEHATPANETCPPGTPIPRINDIDFNATPKPTVLSAYKTYTSTGCYADANPYARALQGAQFSDTTGMTVEKCVDFCEGKGSAFAGVEYAQECYCGGQVSRVSTKVDDSKCDMPCKGNAGEVCGGWGAVNIYQKA